MRDSRRLKTNFRKTHTSYNSPITNLGGFGLKPSRSAAPSLWAQMVKQIEVNDNQNTDAAKKVIQVVKRATCIIFLGAVFNLHPSTTATQVILQTSDSQLLEVMEVDPASLGFALNAMNIGE